MNNLKGPLSMNLTNIYWVLFMYQVLGVKIKQITTKYVAIFFC